MPGRSDVIFFQRRVTEINDDRVEIERTPLLQLMPQGRVLEDEVTAREE
jgi:hypothetical protein